MIARTATALPIELVVKGFPAGEITVAPGFRHRSANRMSAVTTTVASLAWATIQSSAASKPSLTTTRAISGCCGTRKCALLTMVTGTFSR